MHFSNYLAAAAFLLYALAYPTKDLYIRQNQPINIGCGVTYLSSVSLTLYEPLSDTELTALSITFDGIAVAVNQFDNGNIAVDIVCNPAILLEPENINSVTAMQVNTNGITCNFGSTIVATSPYNLCGGYVQQLTSAGGMYNISTDSDLYGDVQCIWCTNP